jgi:hypothetical protein
MSGLIMAGWMAAGLSLAEGQNTASVIGSAVLLENRSVTVPTMGVKIAFHGRDGRTVEAITDEKGEYRTILPSDDTYEISVTGTRLCTVHRPAFEPKPGSLFRFDFVVALCRSYDSVDLDLYGEQNHYREERIAFGKNSSRDLILSFGLRQETDGRVRYEPFNISGSTRLPVTISFGANTVRADTVVLDRETKMFKAEGHVLVADGGTSPPDTESCVMLRFNGPEPLVQPCPTKSLERAPSK